MVSEVVDDKLYEDFYFCCLCKKQIDGMRAVIEDEDDYCLDCFHENFTDERVGEA